MTPAQKNFVEGMRVVKIPSAYRAMTLKLIEIIDSLTIAEFYRELTDKIDCLQSDLDCALKVMSDMKSESSAYQIGFYEGAKKGALEGKAECVRFLRDLGEKSFVMNLQKGIGTAQNHALLEAALELENRDLRSPQGKPLIEIL